MSPWDIIGWILVVVVAVLACAVIAAIVTGMVDGVKDTLAIRRAKRELKVAEIKSGDDSLTVPEEWQKDA